MTKRKPGETLVDLLSRAKHKAATAEVDRTVNGAAIKAVERENTQRTKQKARK